MHRRGLAPGLLHAKYLVSDSRYHLSLVCVWGRFPGNVTVLDTEEEPYVLERNLLHFRMDAST